MDEWILFRLRYGVLDKLLQTVNTEDMIDFLKAHITEPSYEEPEYDEYLEVDFSQDDERQNDEPEKP